MARSAKFSKTVDKIVCKAGEVPNHIKYKLDLEFLTMVCVMVEHLIDNKKEVVKVDKKDVVFCVYGKLFGTLTPTDVQVIESNIQYLFENGKIKQKGIFKVITSSIWDWIKRKIL
ncbi:MAG: hypothetical protein ACO21H_03940 [Sediminibacterium sp.]